MRIGIDISQSVYSNTGVGRFTTGLAETLIQKKGDQWVFLLSSFRSKLPMHLLKQVDSSGMSLKRLPFSPRMLSFLWNDAHILKIESVTGPLDWFISSDWTEPPANAKKATVVHDLVFKRYPETVDPYILSVQEKRLRWVKKESSIIFADSMCTKEDLMQYYAVPSDRIIVNYPGVSVHPVSASTVKKVLNLLGLHRPYILAVGKKEPRKNYDRLIEAFVKLGDVGHDLVIVGPAGWQDIESSSPFVRILNSVNDTELHALYQGSVFFIFPSLYEGFGYPLVEAMLLDIPTAVSQSSSLEEIAGSSSLLFDPLSIGSIQNAIREMIENKTLRNSLRSKGKKTAVSYTWERYYNNMIKALNDFTS